MRKWSSTGWVFWEQTLGWRWSVKRLLQDDPWEGRKGHALGRETQIVRQAHQGLYSPMGSSRYSKPTLGGNSRTLVHHPAQLSGQEPLKEECEPCLKAETDPKAAKYRQLNHTPLLIPILSWAWSK